MECDFLDLSNDNLEDAFDNLIKPKTIQSLSLDAILEDLPKGVKWSRLPEWVGTIQLKNGPVT